MATVTLHEYVARIEALLQAEAYERVISMCQYGLRFYPRFVDFYRMLGQACLESDRPDDAADMFRRVLGVDPQNFVAHVGLGVVAEGMGANDEALWQWERALEVEPNRTAVRDEWKQLRAKRDNTPPNARVKLNRAGLGYVYLRGEQFDRAANEFRSVLAGFPPDAEGRHERFDLQVALAEALYRGGHPREAAEFCRQVLKVLPNALKANLILGDIDLDTGREDEGRLLFEHAKLLDPENVQAAQLLQPPARLNRREVQLPEPDSTLRMPAVAAAGETPSADSAAAQAEPLSPEEAGLPDWLRTLRVHHANVLPTQIERFETGNAPEWLKTIPDLTLVTPAETPAAPPVTASPPAAVEPEPLAGAEAQPLAVGEPAPDAEQPDWLGQVRSPSPADLPVAELLASHDLPAEGHAAVPTLDFAVPGAPASWSSPQPAAVDDSSAPVGETPDWLADLRQGATASSEPPAPAQPATHAPQSTEPPEVIPDWLAELRKLGAESPEPMRDSPAQAESPEPMRDSGAQAAPPEPMRDSGAQAAPPIEPPWMLAAEPSPSALQTEHAVPSPSAPQTESAAREPQAPAAEPSLAPAPASSAARESAIQPAAMFGESLAAATAQTAEPSVAMQPDAALEPAALSASPAALHEEATGAPVAAAAPATQPSRVEASAADSLAAESAQPAPAEIAQPSRVAAPDTEPLVAEAAQSAPARVAQPAPAEAVHTSPVADESLAAEAAQSASAAAALEMAALGAAALLAQSKPEPNAGSATPASQPAEPLAQTPLEAGAGAPPSGAAAESPRETREVTSFLDDSSAPPSVEAQEAPTGAAEYQARLDLARVMKDIDLQSSLELYALMGGAAPALRRQALDEVAALAQLHPEAEEILSHLRAAEPGDAALETAPPATQEAHPVPSAQDAHAEPPAAQDAHAESPAAQDAHAESPAAQEAHAEPSDTVAFTAPHVPQAAPAEHPQPAPRKEGTAYLDDAAAPESIETQIVPTGAAQYAARLELARMLVELDLDTALDQYELMTGAELPLLQQAIADLVRLSAGHAAVARTHAVLNLLRGGPPPQPSPAPASTSLPSVAAPSAESEAALELAAGEAAETAPAMAAPAPAPEAAETSPAHESVAMAPPMAAPTHKAETTPTAAAPTPESAETTPSHAAETTLAETAPAHEAIATAPAMAVPAHEAEITPAEAAPAHEAAAMAPAHEAEVTPAEAAPAHEAAATAPALATPAHEALEIAPALGAVAHELGEAPHLAPAAPAEAMQTLQAQQPEVAAPEPIQTPSAPHAAAATGAESPVLPALPAAATAHAEVPETQAAVHDASATGTMLAGEPVAPVVSEEALESGSSVEGGHVPAPVLPIVDASLADVAATGRAPREAIDFLDDSAAPASVETHAAPTGAAGYQARLALARAMHFIDVDEALDQYSQLAGADESVRADALSDLQALLPQHPRAAQIIARLQSPQPSAPQGTAEPAAPEWLAEAQTPSPADTRLPPAEPVVAEEAMEEELVAPLHPGAPELSSHASALPAAPALEPVVEETAALPVHAMAPTSPHSTPAAEPVPAPVDQPASPPEPLAAQPEQHAPQPEPLATQPDQPAAQSDPDLSSQGTPASHGAPIIEETTAQPVVAQPAPAVTATTVPSAEPLLPETTAQPLHETAPRSVEAAAQDLPAQSVPATVRPAPVEPVIEETAQQTHEAAAPTTAFEPALPTSPAQPAHAQDVAVVDSTTAVPVEPVIEETAALPLHSATATASEPVTPAPGLEESPAVHVPETPVAHVPETPAAHVPETPTAVAPPRADAAPTTAAAEHVMAENTTAAAEHAMAEDAVAPAAAPDLRMVHEALLAAVAPEGTNLESPEPQAAEPEAAHAPAEAMAATPAAASQKPAETEPSPHVPAETPPQPSVAALAETVQPHPAAAPQPPEPQTAPAGESEAMLHLRRARALQEYSQQESAAQYQLLIDGGLLLPEVIADLQAVVQAQPGARHMRMLLAEAFAQAGRHPEAVEQYRKLV